MNHRTKAYFDDLAQRAAVAPAIPRTPWPEARPNACHANCEAFVLRFAGYEVVRGWLVSDGCWFVPHSLVRDTASGTLVDISPDPGNSGAVAFVEHKGTEEEFAVLREGRDGGGCIRSPPICWLAASRHVRVVTGSALKYLQRQLGS
jgi:hypothetical protein